MRTALLLLASAIALLAQPAQQQNYLYTSSTTVVTLQAGTGSTGRTIYGQTAFVSCAGAQTATVSWNGTNATTTAGTVLRLPGTSEPPTATVYTASNVSGGTSAEAVPIPAGAGVILDLSKFVLSGGGGVKQNINISTTGTCIITIQWSEA